MNVVVKLNIACALRWGAASVEIILYWALLTLYGKKHFKYGTCAGGWLSCGATRMKKADVRLL